MDSQSDDFERTQELALRPKTLQEFVGQKRVANQLDLLLSAARNRKSPADHVLLSGPPGLGKTTLAMIIASEMNAPIRITSGPAIQHAGDWLRYFHHSSKVKFCFWMKFIGCHDQRKNFCI